MRIDVVDVGVNILVERLIVLDRKFDRRRLILISPCNINGGTMQRRTAFVQVLNKLS